MPVSVEYSSCNADSIYVLKKETDLSELYTLYYNKNNFSQKIYELNTEDGSSISFMYSFCNKNIGYKCFIINNNSADCNRYLFFNNKDESFYITQTCFSGFYPDKNGVDFDNRILVLNNSNKNGSKEITLEDSILHMPYNDTIKTVKSIIIPIVP
jgi:hypothetical protein